VYIDGAPTIHCFHANCRPAVEGANRRLRQALSTWPASSSLPILPGRREGPCGAANRGLSLRRQQADQVTSALEERAPEILEELAWPYEEILRSSPVPVSALPPREQFAKWAGLWPPGAIVWIGDVTSTGQPRHAANFRPIEDWLRSGPAGNFTCPSAFQPGSCSRTEANVLRREFLVVESDTLTKDQVGAVFKFLARRLHYRLHCIIDTGGKSLHAWFSPPPRALEAELKAGLTVLGCDPRMFGLSQPCRVPGVLREEQNKPQTLIWLRK
jgi:hypothetical protein